MKKILLSAIAVIIVGSIISSCSHDNYQVPPVVQASEQKDTINKFISKQGFSMIELVDSSRIVLVNSSGQYNSLKVLTPGLMYQIVTPGLATQDTVMLSDTAIGGQNANKKIPIYNRITDSTQVISVTYTATLLNGSVVGKSDKPITLELPNTIESWMVLLPKIGKGGHIRFVTPSVYAYGNISDQNYPPNSPLYYDVYLVGALSNSYSSIN